MARTRTMPIKGKTAEIASNDLDITKGRLVAIKSGHADVAVAGDAIVGISKQEKVFESDNETVLKEKLTFAPLDAYSEFEEVVSNGTITQADVGTLYDLASNGTVDGATGGSGDQVRLEKFLKPNYGAFIIAK